MDGETYTPNGSPSTTTVKNRLNGNPNSFNNMSPTSYNNKEEIKGLLEYLNDAHFMKWKTGDVLGVTRMHPVLCAFAFAMISFMFVEYTLYMIPYYSEPFDLGFIVTQGLNRVLAENDGLNTLLAGLNTFVVTRALNRFLAENVGLNTLLAGLNTLRLCLAATLFIFVEYMLFMVPYYSEPFDLGFVVTRGLNRVLVENAGLNTLLAGLNTVYVGMQTMYILWVWLVEGRPRATISALFMFTCRGILGYSTQLPLPKEFLGSGADFPVGNVSFFLFYSGHVAASVIASMDMRRVKRWELARLFDILNILQAIRLLSTRGHYTIDLAVGVGAGILFDSLAGKYEESKRKAAKLSVGNGSGATKNTIEGKNWSMSKNSSF